MRIRIRFDTKIPLVSDDVSDTGKILSIDTCHYNSLADLQFELLRKYVKRDFTPKTAVVMRIEGFSVSTSESISIIRDDDLVEIMLESKAKRRKSGSSSQCVSKTSNFDRVSIANISKSHNCSDAQMTRSNRVKESEEDATSMHSSGSEDDKNHIYGDREASGRKRGNSVTLRGDNKRSNLTQYRYTPKTLPREEKKLSPVAGYFSPTTTPDISAIWKSLKVSEKSSSDPANEHFVTPGNVNGESNRRWCRVQKVPDTPLSRNLSDTSIKPGSNKNVDPMVRSKHEPEDICPEKCNVEDAIELEKYPLVGISSMRQGNIIAFNRCFLCDKTKQPQVSNHVRGEIREISGNYIFVSVKKELCSVDAFRQLISRYGNNCKKNSVVIRLDVGELGSVRLLSESSTSHSVSTSTSSSINVTNVHNKQSSAIASSYSPNFSQVHSCNEVNDSLVSAVNDDSISGNEKISDSMLNTNPDIDTATESMIEACVKRRKQLLAEKCCSL